MTMSQQINPLNFELPLLFAFYAAYWIRSSSTGKISVTSFYTFFFKPNNNWS